VVVPDRLEQYSHGCPTSVASRAKTDNGIRSVDVMPILRDELDAYRSRLDPAPDALVFGTGTRAKGNRTNVRLRMLAPAVERADKRLAKAEVRPLPEGLRPHDLRRMFASLLFAIGEARPYVMAQMGQTTPNLTLTIYARQMDRRDAEPERLNALVQGEIETEKDSNGARAAMVESAEIATKPVESGMQGA
jgi:integrase